MSVAGHHLPIWFDESTGPDDGETPVWNSATSRFESVPVVGGAIPPGTYGTTPDGNPAVALVVGATQTDTGVKSLETVRVKGESIDISHPSLASGGAVGDDNTANHARNNAAILDAIALAKAAGRGRIIIPARSSFRVNTTFEIEDVAGLEILFEGDARMVQGTVGTRTFRVWGDSTDITFRNPTLLGPSTAADDATGNGAAIVIGHDTADVPNAVTKRIKVIDPYIKGFRHAGVLCSGTQFGGVDGTSQRIEDVEVRGGTVEDCTTGLFVYKNCHNIRFIGVTCKNTWDGSISLDTKAASDPWSALLSTDIKILGCTVIHPGVQGTSANVYAVLVKGLYHGVLIDNLQARDIGLDVFRSSIVGRGVYVTADAGDNKGRRITVSNAQIENVYSRDAGGVVGPGDGMGIYDATDVVLSDNQVYNTKRGFYLAGLTRFAVKGNTACKTGPLTTDYPLYIDGSPGYATQSTKGTERGNVWDTDGGGATHAVRIEDADNVSLDPDPVFAGAASYVSLGTNTNVRATMKASATWDPGSLIDDQSTFTDVTVTGAKIGDQVFVDFTGITTNIFQLRGTVRVANSVRVTLTNVSGATNDLPSGTVFVEVRTRTG